MTDAAVRVVETRPTPGTPRPYEFPDVERSRGSRAPPRESQVNHGVDDRHEEQAQQRERRRDRGAQRSGRNR